ncbi:hypothetical protein GS501_01945 [Saccharibacter sp. 17.LH.SD]|uniref:hypothetical protein n=1 Tax=Saccharibacter sp. 17.LH.SD TaxID=2689393 RepID=UPI00136B6822|nr:hypothetical protein [Saccharibacter sp. 17.LH.SD]MXV43815.1 hypothetical protein [Saccharibacter sp. 17.LH.SD]
MKQPRSSSLENGGIKSLAVVTPARFQSLVGRRANEICSRFEEWTVPLTVIGRLGAFPPDTWRRYGVLPLLDQQDGTEIHLEVPSSLVEEDTLKPGDVIRATGFVRARLQRSELVCRLDVVSLEAHDHGASLSSGNGQLLHSFLRDLSVGYHPFPVRPEATLQVLGIGVLPAVLDELCQTLGGLWRESSVQRTLLPANDPLAFVKQFRQTESFDIVLVVADEKSAAMLENQDVLKILSLCPAHRLLVVERGKEGEESLARYVVDHSFPSFVEAGRYIRREKACFREKQEEERAIQEELSALRASIAELTDTSNRKKTKLGIVISLSVLAVVIAFFVLLITNSRVFHYVMGIL